MNSIYTGYFIKSEGEIHDSDGYTNSRIENNQIVTSHGNPTGYMVTSNKIITGEGEFTGYTIFSDHIFGPFKILPWLYERVD